MKKLLYSITLLSCSLQSFASSITTQQTTKAATLAKQQAKKNAISQLGKAVLAAQKANVANAVLMPINKLALAQITAAQTPAIITQIIQNAVAQLTSLTQAAIQIGAQATNPALVPTVPVATVPFSTYLYNCTDHVYNNYSSPSNHAIFLYASDDTETKKSLLNNSGGTNLTGIMMNVNKIYIYTNSSYSGPCLQLTSTGTGNITAVECDVNKKPQSQSYVVNYNGTTAPNLRIFNNPNASSISGLIASM